MRSAAVLTFNVVPVISNVQPIDLCNTTTWNSGEMDWAFAGFRCVVFPGSGDRMRSLRPSCSSPGARTPARIIKLGFALSPWAWCEAQEVSLDGHPLEFMDDRALPGNGG